MLPITKRQAVIYLKFIKKNYLFQFVPAINTVFNYMLLITGSVLLQIIITIIIILIALLLIHHKKTLLLPLIKFNPNLSPFGAVLNMNRYCTYFILKKTNYF